MARALFLWGMAKPFTRLARAFVFQSVKGLPHTRCAVVGLRGGGGGSGSGHQFTKITLSNCTHSSLAILVSSVIRDGYRS
jgi:hypothetical protein